MSEVSDDSPKDIWFTNLALFVYYLYYTKSVLDILELQTFANKNASFFDDN